MTPDRMIELAEQQARHFLIGGKDALMNHLLVEDADGDLLVIGNTPPEFVPGIIKGLRAKAYSILAEAWLATQPEDWKLGDPVGLMPRHRPDRVEAVIAFASDGRDERSFAFRIVRDAEGNCTGLEKMEDGVLGGPTFDVLRRRH